MPNNDLISRAAAIDAIVSVTAFSDAEYIKNLCQNPANSEDWLGGVCDAINVVEDVNAIDAAPVVHAYWIYGRHTSATCSHCHRTYYDAYDLENSDRYCRGCGAKMDADTPTCALTISRSEAGMMNAEHRREKIMEHELRPVQVDIDDAYYEFGRKHREGKTDD